MFSEPHRASWSIQIRRARWSRGSKPGCCVLCVRYWCSPLLHLSRCYLKGTRELLGGWVSVMTDNYISQTSSGIKSPSVFKGFFRERVDSRGGRRQHFICDRVRRPFNNSLKEISIFYSTRKLSSNLLFYFFLALCDQNSDWLEGVVEPEVEYKIQRQAGCSEYLRISNRTLSVRSSLNL